MRYRIEFEPWPLLLWGALFVNFTHFHPIAVMKTTPETALRVAVYDTYVPKKQGGIMHFDILVDANERDLEKVYAYGREYLAAKGQAGQPLTAKECRFCHYEIAKGPIEEAIRKKGYYIVELEGCQ